MTQSHSGASRVAPILLSCSATAFAAVGAPALALEEQAQEPDGTEIAQAPTEPAPATPATPQEATAAPDEQAAIGQELEVIIVTGTRVKGRSPTKSTSPIDAFSRAEVERQGTYDLTDALRIIAPSFNTQRYPISDGTAFIRPANLRNLSPDQTLVLINGHRRHRSALVNLQVEPFGTVNQGAQAVDFGLIPAAAIDRIEVLRDGASAQYGSDAIAGVINILLKQNAKGLSLAGQYGSTYSGDGTRYQLSANWGLPLPGGFFNVTAEHVKADHTSRGSARQDAAAVAAAVGGDKVPFEGLGQRWGDPDAEGDRLFFNLELDATDTLQVYGHGNYVEQDYVSSFFYRTPVGVPGVTPRGTLLVDADGDGAPDDVDQAIVDELRAQGRNPDDFLTPDAGSPSGYVALNPIHTRFPGGYTPSFGADIRDFEGVVGLRGALGGGTWNVSGRLGENRIEYILDDSINPGLGRLSPTSFRPGVLTQREEGLNADFVYPIDVGAFAAPLNTAFGAEYRTEVYKIGIGDPASFESTPTGVLFGVGSDGFQGDPPDAAGKFSQESYAAYVDVETDVTRIVTLGAAARLEDSDAFDASFDWKLSGRVAPASWVALRSTVSTGFRAPTPGQINTLDITTTADASGALVPLGTFPVNSRAARALGATPLEPEESFNVTAGVVFTPLANFSIALDYYRIEVEERIALANFTIVPGSPEQQALIDAGVPNANLIRSVSFFTNAFDTTVEGVELAAIHRADFDAAGYLTVDLRHSENRQKVDRVEAGTIDAERVFDLENQLPRRRSIVSLNYQSPWQVDTLLRINRYGGWQDLTFGERADFGPSWLVDLVATWHIANTYHLSVGGENLFDEYPDEETNGVLRFLGATRPVSSPYGINGGLWFVRVGAEFY